MRRGIISSEMIVCGEGVRSIMLLPLVARCPETIYVCSRLYHSSRGRVATRQA